MNCVRFYKLILIIALSCAAAMNSAGQSDGEITVSDNKPHVAVRGYDGGMMIHAGYIFGSACGESIRGVPLGIGGVIRVHLGEHWRIGTEGYMSTVKMYGNGSYVKYGWGGLLGDFSWTFGRFMPYAGLTIGGGANTNLLMRDDPPHDCTPLSNATYHKTGFLAVDPFVGCDFIVSQAFHLTLKADWLNAIPLGRKPAIPTGPRIYFGFIFYH